MRRLECNPGRQSEWVKKKPDNHHSNVVACALANKRVRMATERADVDYIAAFPAHGQSEVFYKFIN